MPFLPRPRRARIAALAAMLLAATAVFAADSDGNYAVWGAGAKSCHTFNTSGEDAAAGYRQYVMGYLTAYNALANETYSISADQDLDAVMGWLSTYCEDKPMHSFDQALMDYTSSHVADRLKRPPGRLGW
jgi:hypothetical protein